MDQALFQQLAEIQVRPIADRPGQILYNALLDRLTPHGTAPSPRYDLRTQLTIAQSILGVKRDATTTRARLTATATFTLEDRFGPARVFTLTRISSYSQTDSGYATLTAEQDALRRSLREIAEDAKIRLAFLLRTSVTAPTP